MKRRAVVLLLVPLVLSVAVSISSRRSPAVAAAGPSTAPPTLTFLQGQTTTPVRQIPGLLSITF